jgi:iron complex outermembrane recepter protein
LNTIDSQAERRMPTAHRKNGEGKGIMLINTKTGLLAACAVSALSSPAFAQQVASASPEAGTQTAQAESTADAAGGPADGVIVVTARRRSESLSRSPVSVAVVSADTLAKAQIVSENDLRVVTPGLQIRSGSNSNQINYSLRGQTEDPFSSTRPGVLPYFNEVQVGGQGGASTFYDLQSVQVLKGPQGTLFGRSATGGAVLFTTAKPTDTLGGYISGLYGNYNSAKAEGAINVPLVGDQLMARVAGFYRRHDGYQYNLYDGEDSGRQKQYGGRFSLTAKFGPSIRNDLVVDYARSNSQNTSAVLTGLLPFTGSGAPFIPISLLYSGTATPTATFTGECTLQGFAGFPGACPPVNPAVSDFYQKYFSDPHHPANGISGQLAAQQARGPYVIDSDAANIFRSHSTILSNATTFDVAADTQIKNIFGYTRIKSFVNQETDGTPYSASSSPIASTGPAPGQGLFNETRQLSEELQLLGKTFNGRIDYVVGMFVSDERSTTRQQSAFFDLVFGGLYQTSFWTIRNRTYAGYGQGTYKLTDWGLSVTAGARYTSEKVSIETLSGDSERDALGPVPPAGYDYTQSKTYNRLSWTVGLQDQLSPTTLLYVANRRAFKSGGFNGLVQPKIGTANVAGNTYLAERVTDVEGGAKFNGRLGGLPARANLAVYYSWIQNSQRAAFSVVDGSPITATVNVPTGKTYGAEFDGQISPTPWLTLGVVANYTRATFGDDPVFVNGQSQVFDRVPDAPRFSGSVFGDVTVPISDAISVLLHGDAYRQSRSFTSPRSGNSDGTVIPTYTLVNFRVGLEDEKAGWSLTANLKNAFKQRYYVGGVATGEIYQINLLVPGDPRTVTVEARFKF